MSEQIEEIEEREATMGISSGGIGSGKTYTTLKEQITQAVEVLVLHLQKKF